MTSGPTSNELTALPVVGWREAVRFLDLGLGPVRAKVDSGANTSALHVADIERVGDGRVAFHVALNRHGTRLSERLELPIVRVSSVRSSTGHAQERFVVPLRMAIGPHEFEAEVSLVCRQGMLCRMLVGRRALAGRFLVDASRVYVQSERPRRRRSV